jgi:hypothetical protein
MSKEKAEAGFVVLSVILHKSTLSWLVASSEERSEKKKFPKRNYAKVMQKDLLSSAPAKVCQITEEELDFKLFGGFYLTMMRSNPFCKPGELMPMDG